MELKTKMRRKMGDDGGDADEFYDENNWDGIEDDEKLGTEIKKKVEMAIKGKSSKIKYNMQLYELEDADITSYKK